MRLPGSFRARLLLIAAGGLAVRLLYTLAFSRGVPVTGDALTYHIVGERLAAGDGFVRPPHADLPAPLGTGPTAEHPPLFELALGGLDLLGVDSFLGQKAAMCIVGAVTVVLVGMAARLVAGDRAGLVAGALAALYPFLWVADGSLMSESLYGGLIAGSLVLALLFLRTPTLTLALALGAAVGLAALTRGEAVLLVVLLVLPLTLSRPLPWSARAARAGAAIAATALVLLPWTARNLSTFDRPVLISTNASAVLAGANCEDSYHGRFTGLWQLQCYGRRPPGDESEKAAVYRERGLDYARDNAGRVPLVVAARVGRAWDVFHPRQQVKYEYFEGRSRTASTLGLIAYYPLLVLAVAGAVLLRRRGAPLLPLLALPLMVTITAALVYGLTRLRFAAEPAIVVLAAVALDAALGRVRRDSGRAGALAAPG